VDVPLPVPLPVPRAATAVAVAVRHTGRAQAVRRCVPRGARL